MVEYSHFQAELKFQRIRTAIQGKPFEKNVHSAMFCVNSLAKDSNVLRLVNKIKYCSLKVQIEDMEYMKTTGMPKLMFRI